MKKVPSLQYNKLNTKKICQVGVLIKVILRTILKIKFYIKNKKFIFFRNVMNSKIQFLT